MEYYHIKKEFKIAWQKKILQWYSKNKRDLPWRQKKNQQFYNIWISEVMLQQTTVKTVIPYYDKFLKKWPNLETFFNASLDEILLVWQGMGYYQRAKNLYLAKEILKKEKININLEDLKKLPGIGDYVSSAICAILVDQNCTVIDGNIKRIITRAFNLDKNKPNIEKNIKNIATKLTPIRNNRFYCQALMDMANLICKNKTPDCLACPVKIECSYKVNTEPKIKKRLVKRKLGVTYCIKFKDYVLLQRSEGRILENLYCFPVTRFVEVNNELEEQPLLKAIADNWQKINSITHNHVFSKFVKHTFSHFHLKLFIIEINLKRKKRFVDFEWVLKKDIVNKPSSALMKKIQEEVFC